MSIDEARRKPQKWKRWTVVRIVRETFDVEARDRQEALDNANDPHTVKIIRETGFATH